MLWLMVFSFIIFLVKERETKAKHVQFVSGVDAFSCVVSMLLSSYLLVL